MNYDAPSAVQDVLAFGEFGDVNPSITDSATFTFMSQEKMTAAFEGTAEGCFLYSRHFNPTNFYLAQSLAAMEGTEAAQVAGSGMGAITAALFQLVGAGDEIVASRTIYGGSYAFMKNFLPKFNVKTTFVNIVDLKAVEAAITPNTKVIYCETVSNPLLEVANLPELRKLADKHNCTLVVDNTFTPMLISPYKLGAHVVVYSMTKFINGTNDCTAGAICGTQEFISSLMSVNDGATMLIGAVLDPMRGASIHKNLHSLHVRMQKHSENAAYLAEKIEKLGIRMFYPGLPTHPQHELIKTMLNPNYGFGGVITFDVKTSENASKLLEALQLAKVGYFAVSLGFYKTLFSSPGSSTSSEIPQEEQDKMGMTPGLVRFSVGLDHDIERTFERVEKCLRDCNII